jgi:uncharacterized membrane protein
LNTHTHTNATHFTVKFLMSVSISAGWSPTATFVMPGKSTKVKLVTVGEYRRMLIG